jgi:hypothetical protein
MGIRHSRKILLKSDCSYTIIFESFRFHIAKTKRGCTRILQKNEAKCEFHIAPR